MRMMDQQNHTIRIEWAGDAIGQSTIAGKQYIQTTSSAEIIRSN